MLKRIGVICLLLILCVSTTYAETSPADYIERYKDDGTLWKSTIKAIVVPNRLYTIIGVDTYQKQGESEITGGVFEFVQSNREKINIKNIRLLSDYQNIPISMQGYSREVGLEYTTDRFIFVLNEVKHIKAFFETPSSRYIIRITDDKNILYDVFLDVDHVTKIIKVLTP